eukprot:867583-Amorphochlora_amoeboformis.AAC.1
MLIHSIDDVTQTRISMRPSVLRGGDRGGNVFRAAQMDVELRARHIRAAGDGVDVRREDQRQALSLVEISKIVTQNR